MAEVQGRDDLSEELSGLFGGQPAFFHQVVEQLSARDVLQHEVPEGRAQVSRSRKSSVVSLVRHIWKLICATGF